MKVIFLESINYITDVRLGIIYAFKVFINTTDKIFSLALNEPLKQISIPDMTLKQLKQESQKFSFSVSCIYISAWHHNKPF